MILVYYVFTPKLTNLGKLGVLKLYKTA